MRWLRRLVAFVWLPLRRIAVNDWLDGNAKEPEWPDGKQAQVYPCPGCGKPTALDQLHAVDRYMYQTYAPIIRCEECRKPAPADLAFDDRVKPTTQT